MATATSTQWYEDALASVGAEVVVHPAMPVKKGHITMLMAAGLTGVITLERTDEESDPLE